MRAVISRVSEAAVTVDGETVGAIDAPETLGLLALVGVHREDGDSDVETMARKIAELRILPGERGAADLGAPVLVVSQFTLQGETRRGRRPSWAKAAPPEDARGLIDALVANLEGRGLDVETGCFGADMDVSSVNSGPFTVLVDTRRED